MKLLRNIITVSLAFLGLSIGAGAQSEAFLEALRLYYHDDVRAAYTQMRKVIAQEPDNDAAYYYLSTMLRDSTVAGEMLSKAVEIDGDNYWYSYSLAHNCISRGKYAEAAEILEQLISKYPGKTSLYSDLIGVYSASQQTDKALAALDSLESTIGPSDALATYRCEILFSQNKMQEALDYLLDYYNSSKSPRAACLLAQYYASNFNNDEALRYYGEALAANPADSEARYGKAHIHRTLGQYDLYFENITPFLADQSLMPEAKCQYMAELLEQQQFVYTFAPQVDTMMMALYSSAPADSSVLSLSSTYLYQRGRVDDAIALARRNADNYPESFNLNFVYPLMQFYSGDYPAVTASATVALQRFPGNLDLLQLRGSCFYQLGETDSAIDDYRQALAVATTDDQRLSFYSALGDLHHLKGDQKTAFSLYEKALKIDDSYAPVLNNYAYYICLKYTSPVKKVPKDLRKALQMSRKTIEKEPDNATYLDTYAWILHLTGQDLEAKAHFKHAMIYGGKESGVMLRHYATVLKALGEDDLAAIYSKQAERLGE